MVRKWIWMIFPLLLAGAILSAQGEGLALTGVEPAQVVAGGPTTVTIYGSDFTTDATVQLVGFGALSATVHDSGRISATIPANVPAGLYGVEVSANGSQATMADAITVLQPTEEPQVSIQSSEPRRVTSGNSATLSIIGANFTDQTSVRVVGFGVLQTTFLNATTLQASLPGTIAPGLYNIEVRDTVRGSAVLRDALRIAAAPQPPTAAPDPTVTPEQPTPIPGQPSLIVSSFFSNPETILPGGTVTLSFTVVNQGNRSAEGVAAALETGANFVPAPGQASIPLPNIGPGGAVSASITVIASAEAPAGPVTVPLVFTYRDFSGEAYTSKAELSVRVSRVERLPLVKLDNYAFAPDPALPGEAVTIRATLSNTGNQMAAQVAVRITGSDSLLLAGPQGDTFTVGDIQPGAIVPIEMYMIVSTTAKAGPQAQPFTITYFQDGETQTREGSLTINVAQVEVPEALLLLASYDIGQEILTPGDRFTMNMVLRNVGEAAANNLLVTFGTVESSSGDSGSGSGGSTTTSLSTEFAPLGTGGRIFVGTIEADSSSATIEQEFIVSGNVKSGIYNLPITLTYQKVDNTSVQETLYAGVVVIVPPRLQLTLETPLPEEANTGEPLPLEITVLNTGSEQVNLTHATITAENGELLEGANIVLNPLKSDDDLSLLGLVLPLEEGEVMIQVSLFYTDDLNREQTIITSYTTQALTPPPPPEETFFPEPIVEEPIVEEDNFMERLLLGLLGLGSE